MTSAVAGWLPVRLEAMGEEHPAARPATDTPPAMRRKSRRDSARRTMTPPTRCDVHYPNCAGPIFASMQTPAMLVPTAVHNRGSSTLRATTQDGSYPRPLMCREQWHSLDGNWEFAHDDADTGEAERWFAPGAPAFTQHIEVPFPPESEASGILARGFHPVVWYRRSFS